MQSAAATTTNLRQKLLGLNDGKLMKIIFYVLLAFVSLALAYDYRELYLNNQSNPIEPGMAQPILPAYVPETIPGGSMPSLQPNERPEITSDPGLLRNPLQIRLIKGGVLEVTGTIDRGSAERFKQEISDLGEYADRVVLNSPGGSVQDALAISEMIREAGLDTKVRDGDLCASSCPLVLAGGEQRIAGRKAAIGVHQIYAPGDQRLTADQEISGTQTVTAAINRHLREMDVNPALWLHALDTPPQHLYYLNNSELESYKLITEFE